MSYLKILGLASELVSGEKNSAPGFNFFTVDIELTIDGLRKSHTHTHVSVAVTPFDFFRVEQWERVIYIVYQYMAMLREQGPKEWIFNECKVGSRV